MHRIPPAIFGVIGSEKTMIPIRTPVRGSKVLNNPAVCGPTALIPFWKKIVAKIETMNAKNTAIPQVT